MSDEAKKEKVVDNKYRPEKKEGYQPSEGNLDSARPPQGGSGVPPKSTSGGNSEGDNE
jgi:hypothetical protein